MHQALLTVKGLRKGKTDARESKKVRPVDPPAEPHVLYDSGCLRGPAMPTGCLVLATGHYQGFGVVPWLNDTP